MKIGNTDITNPKIGATDINKVFIGLNKVWPNIDSEFIFTIDTSLGDGLAEFEFNPSNGGFVDYIIDWGDSTSTNVSTNGATNHVYSTGGIYQVKIEITSGINNYNFNASADKLKLISVDNWGAYLLGFGGTNMFRFCTNLLTVPLTPPPVSLNHRGMFSFCSSLNSDFNDYVFTGTMEEVFRSCSSLNGSFTNVDTTSVTNFQRAFAACSSFSGSNDLSSITFESASTLWRCFRNCTNLDFGGLSSPTNAATLDLTFQNTSLSNTNYRLMLNAFTGWNGTTATKTLQNNVPAHFGIAKYEIGGESEDIRNYLTGTLGWTITDGGGI